MEEVEVGSAAFACYSPLIGSERVTQVEEEARRVAATLGHRTVWNVNSTAFGGGVAEMLHGLIPHCRGFGLDVRWLVMSGDDEFFQITKRICNGLYGNPGDGGPLDDAEHRHYRDVIEANVTPFRRFVAPGDVVILHDPQTAGMSEAICERARVIWRCHVGSDEQNRYAQRAWEFLSPYLREIDAAVFSTAAHVPAWIQGRTKVAVISPAIDPFSAKNCALERQDVEAILTSAGVLEGGGSPAGGVIRCHDRTVEIERKAVIVGDVGPTDVDAPLVVQVSRWDRLKDMQGVLEAFARYVDGGAYLALVGPDFEGVADDPEGALMFKECRELWRALRPEQRRRIRLICLPMEDPAENALMVNAIQRHASVVVQKSLAEGFGLTVTEAMWKKSPVVASAVGGIREQIVHEESGVLVRPRDLRGLGAWISTLLEDPQRAQALGHSAHVRVLRMYLPDRQLLQWGDLLQAVAGKDRMNGPGGSCREMG